MAGWGFDKRYLVYIALILLFFSAYKPGGLVFFGLLFITSYWITRENVLYSIYIAVGISLILQLCCGGLGRDNFENQFRMGALMERMENQIKPPEEELGVVPVKPGQAGDPENVVEAVLKKAVEAKDEDKPVSGNQSEYVKNINTYDLAKAQKETFKMVDSISQLKDVMASLSPLLKQGGEVIKMMDQLKVSGGLPKSV